MSSQGIHHRRVVQRVLFHLASLALVLVVVAVLEARVHSHIIVIRRLLPTRLSLDTLLVGRALTASLISASSVLLGAGSMLSVNLSLSLKLSLDKMLCVGLLGLGVSLSLRRSGRMHTSRRGGHPGNNGNGDGGGALTGGTRDNRGRNRGDTRTGSTRLGDRSCAGGRLSLGRVLLLLGTTTSRSRPPRDGVHGRIHPPVGVRRGGCSAALALVLGAAKALEVLSAVGMLAHGSLYVYWGAKETG